MSEAFFQRLKTWSRIKHIILAPYLKLFLSKVGSSVHRIYVVDGFAGQGKYDDGEDGSPLLAAKLAANPKLIGREGVLRCIKVEKVDDLFRATGLRRSFTATPT